MPDINESKSDCTIAVKHNTFNGTAHLFEVEYDHHTFWFGVAQVVGLDKSLSMFILTLEDGRYGTAHVRSMLAGEDGYQEIAFTGLDALKPPE